jgi:hypothetical protein
MRALLLNILDGDGGGRTHRHAGTTPGASGHVYLGLCDRSHRQFEADGEGFAAVTAASALNVLFGQATCFNHRFGVPGWFDFWQKQGLRARLGTLITKGTFANFKINARKAAVGGANNPGRALLYAFTTLSTQVGKLRCFYPWQ